MTDATAAIRFVAYGDDPLARLAALLIERHRVLLPDLSSVAVLLPAPEAAPRLRRQLLGEAARQGFSALLGPRVFSLREWAAQFAPASPTIAPHARELLLLNALRRHPGLYGQASPWTLVDDLLTLFDELTLNDAALPDDAEQFLARLQSSYGLRRRPAHLGREAELVHTLWRAWHQELRETQLLDPHAAHALGLAESASHPPAGALYLAGVSRLSRAESTWLKRMLANGAITVLLHGEAAPAGDHTPSNALRALMNQLEQPAPAPAAHEPYGALLHAVYEEQGAPLRQRATEFAARHPRSPAAGRLRLLAADHAEQEARAIDIQTRQWLLDGATRVGIVTENRRLARRVRALLERAGIAMQDQAGWALSTTRAAACLERWLEAVESDFGYRPLLDLLKSPFFQPRRDRQRLLAAAFYLEREIILQDQVPSGLQRYRRHLEYRAKNLPPYLAEHGRLIGELLDILEQAAQPLLEMHGDKPWPATMFLNALRTSLERLGLLQSYEGDTAGQCVLQELEGMRAADPRNSARMTWLEFRTWLGRTLERANFRPPGTGTPVHLMGLQHSPLQRFDALIIAGAEREYLPGAGTPSPFFNQAVRRELGLPTAQDDFDQRFHHFRRLLEAAPRVLITYRHEQDGEPILPCPWVEQLAAFHGLAYGDGLHDAKLKQLALLPETQVVSADPLPLPPPVAMPRPALPERLLPATLSASAYQDLIDCPYRFFAGRGLGLAPPETIREALEKSDYGDRVHRCLEAFHQSVPGLPGPFAQPLTTANRAQAIHCLEDISHAVFARDIEDNFQHRGWIRLWLMIVPHYIDWQIERESHWRVEATEARARQEQLVPGLALTGRLDRIDRDTAGGRAILDYKTGAVPAAKDIAAGEAVQLPFYALLHDGVGQVDYLGLHRDKVAATGLAGAELESLRDGNRDRLQQLWQAIRDGAGLPAWGDEKTCEYCEMSGVCRRQVWVDESGTAPLSSVQ